MPIQVLPPQLANQIAAGEVVERPASVVKELVENSLDAGATRIDIEIERGGAKLIRIRDNGCGINKDELALALARHATSKITSLDDLEAIMSLGFRGEALASVSSVSRLTMTSRTAEQSEAWQAYAEGRDMAVTVKPAAHPIGTTVEVLDLFYNTPARRKFMRTEKTEFGHIDEVVRRIALARFDVTIQLHHNGKMMRQYRAVKEDGQKERRLGSICGTAFIQHALEIKWEHGDLAIHGWVADPVGSRQLTEMQYSYVNGRMMRDKLITHAIRQAYQDQLKDDQQPAYVLYLTVDPHQVDVNVHPAKHEVRFHQARLVHDFIYQAVISVLQQAEQPSLPEVVAEAEETPRWEPENRVAAGVNQFSKTPMREPSPAYGKSTSHGSASEKRAPSENRHFSAGDGYQKQEGQLYQRLMQVPEKRMPQPQVVQQQDVLSAENSRKTEMFPQPACAPLQHGENSFGRVLTICERYYALLERQHGVALLNLNVAEIELRQVQLLPSAEGLRPQPLLIPVKLTLNAEEIKGAQSCAETLKNLGIDLILERQRATLRAVPLPLRHQNLPQLIPAFLAFLAATPEAESAVISTWLAGQLVTEREQWSVSQAIQLLAEVERLCPVLVKSPPSALLQPVDLTPALVSLQSH